MAANKKPRKKYSPNKTVCNTPLVFRYSKEAGDGLKIRIYFHLHRFINNEADAGDYLALRFRLRVGLKLTKYFIEEDLKLLMEDALAVLEDIKLERIASGKWVITKPQEHTIRYALSFVDDMMDKSTRKEQLPIFLETEKEVDHSLYGKLN